MASEVKGVRLRLGCQTRLENPRRPDSNPAREYRCLTGECLAPTHHPSRRASPCQLHALRLGGRCSCPAWQQRPYVSSRSRDRKSTRLNSSHVAISYAVFCLKKKKNN